MSDALDRNRISLRVARHAQIDKRAESGQTPVFFVGDAFGESEVRAPGGSPFRVTRDTNGAIEPGNLADLVGGPSFVRLGGMPHISEEVLASQVALTGGGVSYQFVRDEDDPDDPGPTPPGSPSLNLGNWGAGGSYNNGSTSTSDGSTPSPGAPFEGTWGTGVTTTTLQITGEFITASGTRIRSVMIRDFSVLVTYSGDRAADQFGEHPGQDLFDIYDPVTVFNHTGLTIPMHFARKGSLIYGLSQTSAPLRESADTGATWVDSASAIQPPHIATLNWLQHMISATESAMLVAGVAGYVGDVYGVFVYRFNGSTWNQTLSGPDPDFEPEQIRAILPGTGTKWAIATETNAWFSDDDGLTWAKDSPPISSQFAGSYTSDAIVGAAWVAGDALITLTRTGRIWRRSGAGVWQFITTPLSSNNPGHLQLAIVAGNLEALTVRYPDWMALRSSDAGLTWSSFQIVL